MTTSRAFPVPTLLAGAGLLALALAACRPTVPPADESTAFAPRPECPTHDSTVFYRVNPKDGSATAVVVKSIAGSGRISFVPEYHDCQRLVTGTPDQPTYGTLAAVFVDQGARAQFDSLARRPDVALSVATILSYDGDYEPLHLKHGFNCLYVSQAGTEYSARVLAVDSDQECLKERNPADPTWGHALAVHPRTPPPALGADAVPAVARWDWDEKSRVHYIGLGCSTRWCAISQPASFTPSQDWFSAGNVTQEVGVKGWYDQQDLASDPNPGAAGPLAVSGVVGVVVPHPDLKTRIGDDDEAAYEEFQPVARVFLLSPSAEYRAKYGFEAGGLTAGLVTGPGNLIEFCHGTKCKIPDEPVCADPLPLGADRWWARITPPSGAPPVYRCVIRRQHDGLEIPATVRWRWRTDDEGIWARCPKGCCELT